MADPDKSIYGRASGTALKTVEAHSKPDDLKCFFSWFCPYVLSCLGRTDQEVQRVWIALEEKKANYEYIEIQPYHKPKELLDVNPKGLVPAILKDGYSLAESLVLIEYIDEAFPSNPLLPGDPLLRARCRLAIDFINRSICPSFYRYLQEQEESKWDTLKTELVHHMLAFGKQLLENDEKYSSEKVDIALIPWVIRMPLVLEKYKGFKLPSGSDSEEGRAWKRIHEWIDAAISRRSVAATTSEEREYFKVYERYARNTANSMVARATRAGGSLP